MLHTINKQSSINKILLYLRRYYWSMPYCHYFIKTHVMRYTYMSSEVVALPFQAHSNYGTWSIDFELNRYQSLKLVFEV